ncbi:MAG: glycosyltransferase [Ignavibacteria bacterium]|nr:glycosyltransferase [Ignavibacteria bacterium]
MKGKLICHICFSEYPSDQRVRRYVNELISNGYDVVIICIADEFNKKSEFNDKVRIIRLNVSKKRGSYSSRFSEYLMFFLKSFFMSIYVYFKYRPVIYHMHTFPDFIVFAGIFPKLAGSKLILDMHELTPEAMMMRENLSDKNLLIRFLKFTEKLSVKFADRVITIHEIAEEILRKRNKKEFISIMNGVDRREAGEIQKKSDGYFNLVYNGTINPNLNLGLVVKSMIVLREKLNEAQSEKIRFLLYGKGPDLNNLLKEAESTGLSEQVIYKGNLNYKEMLSELAYASAAVYPPLPNIYTDICYPIKITEMINFRIPVIASRYKTLIHFYPEDCIFYFNPGDANDMAERIIEVMNDPRKVSDKTENAFNKFRNYSWENVMKKKYMKLIDELSEGKKNET